MKHAQTEKEFPLHAWTSSTGQSCPVLLVGPCALGAKGRASYLVCCLLLAHCSHCKPRPRPFRRSGGLMRGALRRRASSSGSQEGAAINGAEVAGSRSARLNQALCLLFVIVLVVLGRQAGVVEKQSMSSHITDHVEVDPYGVVPALRAPRGPKDPRWIGSSRLLRPRWGHHKNNKRFLPWWLVATVA